MKKILIVGCGDIALRVARLLHPRYRLFGLARNPARHTVLREAGIVPIAGDLDLPASLHRLGGLADIVLHFAPPPTALAGDTNETDSRTRNLIAALSQGRLPRRIIYISTSGVYGDCAGAEVAETRAISAQSLRAKRRIDAENKIRHWAAHSGVQANILRVPGIYSAERLPLERLRKGTPALIASEDGYTNHIHADDLARIVVSALRYAKANRVYHTADDSQMKMGDYFVAVADAFNLPPPPRVTRAVAQKVLSPMLLSFMNESRRLTNTRMKQELKMVMRYPTVAHTLAAIKQPGLVVSVAPISALQPQTQLPLLLV